jgi:hypothetical protein
MDNEQMIGTPGSMNTMSEIMTLAATRGFVTAFRVTPKGLFAAEPERYFSPAQTHIENFYRFEGASNPDDMSILYLIKTRDGSKGTLVDAYGTYADSLTSDFIKKVEDIHKAPSA